MSFEIFVEKRKLQYKNWSVAGISDVQLICIRSLLRKYRALDGLVGDLYRQSCSLGLHLAIQRGALKRTKLSLSQKNIIASSQI